MKVIFTRHAELKMRQRRITKGLVLKSLSSADFFRPSYGNREVAYKKIGKNYLAVIFLREKDAHIVITQHWVAKIGKFK